MRGMRRVAPFNQPHKSTNVNVAPFDYTFYPWVKDRWAAGFGLGFRWIDLATTLSWRLEGDETIEDSQDADVSAPLPYIYFEYPGC